MVSIRTMLVLMYSLSYPSHYFRGKVRLYVLPWSRTDTNKPFEKLEEIKGINNFPFVSQVTFSDSWF